MNVRLLLATAAVVVAAGALARGDAYPEQAMRVRIEQGVTNGLQYQKSRDNKSKDASKRDLEEVIKTAKEFLKHDGSCAVCAEHLVMADYYYAAFGFTKSFDQAVEDATPLLSQFPTDGRFSLFAGAALYQKGRFADAGQAFKRYQISTFRNAEHDAFMQPMLDDCQKKFLTAWYNQANFYQSGESRIEQFNTQTFKNEVVFQFTADYELQLGHQGFDALTKGAPRANDPEAVAFLQQLVDRLVAKTPGPGQRYEVSLVNAAEVNAVTPPGYIVVNTGLLKFVDTEAQLAGVLSHEIAHNYAHHPARRLIKAYHAQQITAAITKAVNPKGAVAQAITGISTQVGLGLFLNAYSRFEEKEADLYGSHIMFNGGYNPTALSGFFLKMDRANPKQPPKLLSTHPPLPDRTDYLTDYIEGFPLDRDLVIGSSDAFKKVKERYRQ